jgi:RecA-family ATPase
MSITPTPLPFINMANWDNEEVPNREWAVVNRIPLRQTSLVSGAGGIGKSYIILHECVAHVLARDWLRSQPTPGPAIFLDAEDDESEIHRRLGSILRHYEATYAEVMKAGLHLMSFVGRDAVLAVAPRNGKLEPTTLYHQLLQAAGDLQPKLIGIASSANVFAGNENDRSQVQQFIGLLTRLAQVANGAVQLISHPSLTGFASGSGISGSTQWHNAVRARAVLQTVKLEGSHTADTDLRELVFKKNQYGPAIDSILIRYQNGMFLPEESALPSDKVKQLEIAKDVFLRLVDRFNAGNLDANNRIGRHYAPTLFVDEPEAQAAGLTKALLTDAMRQLLTENELHIEDSGTPSRPRYRFAKGMSPEWKAALENAKTDSKADAKAGDMAKKLAAGRAQRVAAVRGSPDRYEDAVKAAKPAKHDTSDS